jgi:hypothetical protein
LVFVAGGFVVWFPHPHKSRIAGDIETMTLAVATVPNRQVQNLRKHGKCLRNEKETAEIQADWDKCLRELKIHGFVPPAPPPGALHPATLQFAFFPSNWPVDFPGIKKACFCLRAFAPAAPCAWKAICSYL